MTYGADSYKAMAQRMETARAGFLETLMNCGGIGKPEAEKVLAFYFKAKIIKTEYAVSRMTVKHGAFLDRETILRALEKAA